MPSCAKSWLFYAMLYEDLVIYGLGEGQKNKKFKFELFQFYNMFPGFQKDKDEL